MSIVVGVSSAETWVIGKKESINKTTIKGAVKKRLLSRMIGIRKALLHVLILEISIWKLLFLAIVI